MKILMFIILFLLIGAFFIISNENLSMKDSENREKFFDMYGHWFDKLADNGKTVSGYLVKMGWLPEEEVEKPSYRR